MEEGAGAKSEGGCGATHRILDVGALGKFEVPRQSLQPHDSVITVPSRQCNPGEDARMIGDPRIRIENHNATINGE